MEALEPESRLIDSIRDLVRTNMLSRKIKIIPVDYASLELKSEKYDVIYSRDRLYATPHKAHIISQAAGALKKGGKLLIVDYMVASRDNSSPDFLHWSEQEPEAPCPGRRDSMSRRSPPPGSSCALRTISPSSISSTSKPAGRRCCGNWRHPGSSAPTSMR